MPIFKVSGDLLHAFVIEVEAENSEEAKNKVENLEIPRIEDYDTSNPGISVDWVEELNAEENNVKSY